MKWDDLFETMLKEIAAELGLKLSKSRAGYLLSKGSKVIGLSYFVNRDGKLKILMSPEGSGRPIDLGNYTMDDLKFENSNARKTLTVKIKEKISKQ